MIILLIIFLLFGLFALCDFVVNLVQVECLDHILLGEVELLQLSAALDDRSFLQSSAVLHQDNCRKLLRHGISSDFEFLGDVFMSADIN